MVRHGKWYGMAWYKNSYGMAWYKISALQRLLGPMHSKYSCTATEERRWLQYIERRGRACGNPRVSACCAHVVLLLTVRTHPLSRPLGLLSVRVAADFVLVNRCVTFFVSCFAPVKPGESTPLSGFRGEKLIPETDDSRMFLSHEAAQDAGREH